MDFINWTGSIVKKNTAYILLHLIIALRAINAQEYDLES